MWRPLQDGQTPRPLQENATTNARPQPVHRARANPKQRMPHSRLSSPAAGLILGLTQAGVMSRFAIGTLVRARGREWGVLPESQDDLVILRPLAGMAEPAWPKRSPGSWAFYAAAAALYRDRT